MGHQRRTRDATQVISNSTARAARHGDYGFCEVTGTDQLARLEARPIATMTVEAQERHEKNERISRDD